MFYKKVIFQKYKKTYQKKMNSENIFFNNFLKENNLNQARYFNLHNEHIFGRVFSDGTFRVINLTNSKINIDSIEIGKANYKKRLNLKVLKILEKFQLPMKIKKKKADFIIQNNFKIKKLKKNVKVLKNKILNYERNSSRY